MEDKIILGVGAHPDDIDFTASGTIAKWVEEGATAYYLICTDGSRGSDDPTMTHEKLVTMRKKEQESAADILGVKKVFFLNHLDTQLTPDDELKEEIVRFIRKLKPTTVITMNPTFFFKADIEPGFINHTDHRAVGLATMDAVFPLARDRLTFHHHEQEGLKSHKVRELLFTNLDTPEYVVDISGTFNKKIAAIQAHKSQFADVGSVLKRTEERAQFFGTLKGYKYAENFSKIVLT